MDIKSSKFLKVVAAILVGIAGILTIVFSIVALISNKGEPSAAIRYLLGASLCVAGVAIIVVALSKETESKKNIFDLVTGGSLLGLGIFFFLEGAKEILDVLVCFILPLIIACVGVAFFFKAIICLSKNHNKDKNIILIIASVLMIVAGILFAIFVIKNKGLQQVVWLLVGIAIFSLSIYDIISTARNNK